MINKKYILFVCWHNSWRSQMAEVYFNTYNKNPNLEAFSAWTGLKWDWKINPKIIELLKSKWIDILNQDKKYFPKILTDEMVKWAHKVYTMWCMDWCMIWNRKADFDFKLNDPACEDINVEELWGEFEEKIKIILK